MIVGVNADLVAVFRHAPDKGLLTLDAVAHQEEGGLDLPESRPSSRREVVEVLGPSSR